MRVTSLELPAVHGDVDGQLGRVRRALSEDARTTLVLLPEAALTGYVSPRGDFDLSRFAEPRDGAIASALSGLAREFGVHLIGPVIERDGAARYNAMRGYAPDGSCFVHYRKRHPWYPEAWATPGEAPHPKFTVDGVTFTIAVCFDVHFLAEEAAAELEAADVLLFPSAWVEADDSRHVLLPALARRFDVAIVNANWGVGAPPVAGQGGSMIVDRGGAIVARALDGRADAEL